MRRSWISLIRCGSVAVSASARRRVRSVSAASTPVDQRIAAARRLLRDIADAVGLRQRDVAVISGQIAGNETQKRRLARTIATNDTDLVPGRQPGAGLVEDRPPLDAVGQIVDVQHGCPDTLTGCLVSRSGLQGTLSQDQQSVATALG